MQNRRSFIALIIIELVTFVSMILGITFSIFDIRFMVNYPRLAGLPIYMTFTGLSNIFVGLVCLICAIYRLVKKEMILPKLLFVIKIIALAEITITFVITAIYLAPSIGTSWWRLYINNNIFNHFLTPLLAVISFITLEQKVEIKKLSCLYAIIPIILYGALYVPNVYLHLNPDGTTSLDYDIYGFARFGVGVLIIFMLVFIAISVGLTFLYRFIGSKKTASPAVSSQSE
jgi:hypothetical protein